MLRIISQCCIMKVTESRITWRGRLNCWYRPSVKDVLKPKWILDCLPKMGWSRKNIIKAVELLTLSANQGNAVGQYNLAVSYQEGDGVDKNLTSFSLCQPIKDIPMQCISWIFLALASEKVGMERRDGMDDKVESVTVKIFFSVTAADRITISFDSGCCSIRTKWERMVGVLTQFFSDVEFPPPHPQCCPCREHWGGEPSLGQRRKCECERSGLSAALLFIHRLSLEIPLFIMPVVRGMFQWPLSSCPEEEMEMIAMKFVPLMILSHGIRMDPPPSTALASTDTIKSHPSSWNMEQQWTSKRMSVCSQDDCEIWLYERRIC
jgi:hypothetical protein